MERQADPADRRTRRVVVTATGDEMLRGLTAKLTQTEHQLLDGLDDNEANLLRDLLQRVATRVSGGDGEPLSCG